jgi:hypothetical protein
VREGGGGEGEGGCQKTTAAKKRDLKFCWLEFAKNFEKFFEKSYGPFLTFLPTFFELVIKVKKNKKSFGYSLKATDM